MNNINHWYARYRASEGTERELALRNLYKHVYNQALGAIYTALKRERPDLATDAASDTILKMPQFRGDSEFATWAYKIARNVALMEARKLNSRREAQFEVDADEIESDEDEEAWQLPNGINTATSLNGDDRDLLDAILNGLRAQDWAEMNNLSRQTGWYRWQRLKKRLKRVIGTNLEPFIR